MDKTAEELIVVKQLISIPQRFATGPVMGKFLRALKNRQILANECHRCGRRQIPPREICAVCRIRVNEWVEVGPEGVLVNYDIVYYASPDPLTGKSRETPYVSAHIVLDGCKDGETLWHELNPGDIPRIKKGVRVRPVWNETRIGSVADIRYFEIIEHPIGANKS